MLNTIALKPGDKVRLIHFGATDLSYRRRLLAMGVTCGVEVQIVRRAPLGCPLQIDLRGTSLIIRENEARYLEWEYI